MTKPSKQSVLEHLQPYSDEELTFSDEMQEKVNKLMEWLDQNGIEYDKYNPNDIPKLDFGKKDAYPNFDQYMHIPGQHDTEKWLQAISDVYRKERGGENRIQAIRQVTSGWNIMETFDFLNWVKFHESGDHMKYKFAQLWYENPDLPGYALQIKKDPPPPQKMQTDGPAIDFARDRETENADRRERIEKQRNKIIGRLDSAEKLLRSPDGHAFSGKEFETLLEAIYQLKKKIQMVNKISSSTRLYEDMIVREANVLHKHGFHKAAGVLYSVAQTPAQSAGLDSNAAPLGDASTAPPSPTPPGDPSGAGNPSPPSGGAGTPAQPTGLPDMPQSEPPAPKGITEFLANLDESQVSGEDEAVVEDDLEVMDSDAPLFVTEAQAAPVDEPITTAPAPAPLDPAPVAAPKAKPPAAPAVEEEPLEVTEDDIKAKPQATPSVSNFDAKVDAALAGVTVADVVAKLEDLAKIFKTREVPRQLGIVDMMLDHLGLASYFPSLSEATNKALESNNYIQSRVEDILSKLRGAMGGTEVDLKGGPEVDNPEVAGVKNKLQTDADKEKARKQMRKEQENAELENKGKETPEVEIEEDLGAPVAPPAAPARPAAPPTA